MSRNIGSMSSIGSGSGRSALFRRGNIFVRNPLSSTTVAQKRTEKLEGRLEEQIIFEIIKDGDSNIKNLNVRDLYSYVVNAITQQQPGKKVRSNALRATVKLRNSFMNNANQMKAPTTNNLLNSLGTLNEEEDYSSSSFSPPHLPPLTEEPPPDVLNSPTNMFQKRVLFRDEEKGQDSDSDDDEEEPTEVTYRERLGGYLHPRDVRKLYTPFSASDEPELIVRRHVILLNFDTLRAIILRDRLLVFIPQGADSILEDLEKKVRSGVAGAFGTGSVRRKAGDDEDDLLIISKIKKRHNTYNEKDMDANSNHDNDYFDDEWDELKNGDGWMVDLPFELRCIDAVLDTVTNIFKVDANEFMDEAEETIIALRNSHGLDSSKLRQHKDTLIHMSVRVDAFSRALNEALDSNEDMALMNISRLLTHPERFIQPVPEAILNEEADEPELILEAHLQETNTLTNELELLKGIITTTEEDLNQRSNTVRNRLLYAEMVISIVSLNVSLASMIGAYIGMNVTNGMELNPTAFLKIVIGTSVGVFLLMLVLIFGLSESGVLPSMKEL